MIKKAILIFFMISLMVCTSGCFRVINDGEVGVKKTLGNYEDEELDTGLKFFMPIVSFVSKVDVKKTTVDEHISVPTSEGLVVELDVSVIYKVKADQASEIKQTVYGDIKDTLLIPYIRNSVRDEVSGYTAEAVYKKETRKGIAEIILKQLQEKVGDQLVIVDVLMRDVKLPPKVKEAIEAKVTAEHDLQKMDKTKEIAEKQAEIDITRAQGLAQSNKIIANSITDEYLKWKFIEALEKSDAQLIYIPTEANLPVMEATRLQQTFNTP